MVLIAVHGSAVRLLPAERGTVRLSLEVEHAERASAVEQVVALHDRFRSEAERFVQDGTATRWGSGQVRVRAEDRYEDRYEGRDEQRTRIQVASATVEVRFRDLTALAAWIVDAGSVEGVGVEGVEWAITREREAQELRALRVEAVQDAVARAEAYASVIGGTGVELRAVWEAGLRPAAGSAEGRSIAFATSRRSSPRLELRPEEIELTAAVTADFEVDPPR